MINRLGGHRNVFHSTSTIHRLLQRVIVVSHFSPYFYRIKRKSCGMLPSAVYRRIHRLATKHPNSNMLDIGTGRGATSISLGTAIKRFSGRGLVYAVDQFYQQSASKPHRYTIATNPDDCVSLNLQEFRRNLERFGVEDVVKIVVGKTSDALRHISNNTTFSLLSLDVDGNLDRDLVLFYNLLKPGAEIIIDDYSKRIDRNGQRNIRHCIQFGISPETFLSDKNAFERGRILGKHYLTWKLLNL